MEATKNITASTETPRISPETAQTVECTNETEKATHGANKAIAAYKAGEWRKGHEGAKLNLVDLIPVVNGFKFAGVELFDYGSRKNVYRVVLFNLTEEGLAVGSWWMRWGKNMENIPVFDTPEEARRFVAGELPTPDKPAETPADGETDAQAVNVSPEQGNADRERENEPKRISNGVWDIPTVDISLYRDYKAGILTLRQCAEEFCRCGWTNYIDEDYTRCKFARIEQRELAAAI